jgi:hypothetical protein
MASDIYWGVEHTAEGYYLHAFPDWDARRKWLWEREGLSLSSEDGRGIPADLPPRYNPFFQEKEIPIIWHDK